MYNSKHITKCMGYQQIGAGATVASVGLTVPTGVNGNKPSFALIQAEAQDARWRDDGVAPTAAIGMLLPVGVPVVYTGDLNGIRFINKTAGTILNISFYS